VCVVMHNSVLGPVSSALGGGMPTALGIPGDALPGHEGDPRPRAEGGDWDSCGGSQSLRTWRGHSRWSMSS
jgi:hypothetical protein